jgi:hypothetical protein
MSNINLINAVIHTPSNTAYQNVYNIVLLVNHVSGTPSEGAGEVVCTKGVHTLIGRQTFTVCEHNHSTLSRSTPLQKSAASLPQSMGVYHVNTCSVSANQVLPQSMGVHAVNTCSVSANQVLPQSMGVHAVNTCSVSANFVCLFTCLFIK